MYIHIYIHTYICIYIFGENISGKLKGRGRAASPDEVETISGKLKGRGTFSKPIGLERSDRVRSMLTYRRARLLPSPRACAS